MTSEQGKGKAKKNAWEKFIETGKGGDQAVRTKSRPKHYSVSTKQQRALRRNQAI